MGSTVTLNANALATVDDVLREYGKTRKEVSSDFLDYVCDLINMNSSAIENFLDRELGYEEGLVELHAGYGGPWLLLCKTPVWEVTDVQLLGPLGTASAYDVDLGALKIPKPGNGRVYNSYCWPNTAKMLRGNIANDFEAGTESPCIQITYNGGYNLDPKNPIEGVADLPLDIRRALILQTSTDINQQAKDRSVRREQLMNWSVEYDRGTLFAPDGKDRKGSRPFSEIVMGLLAPHVRIGGC